MLTRWKQALDSFLIRNLNALIEVIRNLLKLFVSVKFRVEMAIPFLDKNHNKVDPTAIKDVVAQVRNKCGGHNLVPALGEWVSPAGKVFTENLLLLRTDTDYANVVWLRNKAAHDWRKSLNQEEMFMTVSVTFWII